MLSTALQHAIKDTASPFVTGSDITTADGALFPTVVFMMYILPKYFGWVQCGYWLLSCR